MTQSAILGINQVGEDQTDKYITINDAFDALEEATNARLEISAADAFPVTLNELQATRYMQYRVADKTGNFDFVMPSEIGISIPAPAQRVFVVINDTAHECTVKASTGAGSTVVIPAGGRFLIAQSFENVTPITGYFTTAPYDTGFFMPGTPSDGAIVMKFIASRPFFLPDDFAGSRGQCGINPTSPVVFAVKKNGADIGTISISTGGVFTFSTTGAGNETFAAGDILSVVAPSPVDPALSDVVVSFFGRRNLS